MTITIQTMRAAGLTEAQIVRVLEVEQQERIAAQREQSRVRSQNYRDRHAQKRDASRTSRVTSVTDPVCVSKESKNSKRSKHTLPENWALSEQDRAYARTKGWADDRITTEGERFRLYYVTKGTMITSDHLCWCKWVMSPYQTNGNGGQHHGRRHGSVLDAFDRLSEKLHAQGSFGDQYVPGSSGPTPLRLDHDVRPTGLKLVPKG